MKRILWATVEKAYKKTGLTPALDVTVSDGYACPVGAIYCDATKTNPTLVEDVEVLMHHSIYSWLCLTYEREYLLGFLAGFDAVPHKNFKLKEDFDEGYKDGRNIRIRFEKEGLL